MTAINANPGPKRVPTTPDSRVQYAPLNMGCDPEFFFEGKGGGVIGAEKVLKGGRMGSFVLDGVQVELNPTPDTCRARLSNQISLAFQNLSDHLKTLDSISASFTSVVEVSKQELDTLSDQAKVFGCAPSLNSYDKVGDVSKVTVDAATYPKRSAGGHIHLGLEAGMMPHRERLIPLLDILLGNTCVLIDRDPNAAERRKVYGRAGEFRLPKHGIEYRTLSNFWLRAYPLFSLVFGLTRLAHSVLRSTEIRGGSYDHIQHATYTNDGKYTPDIFIFHTWDAEGDLLRRVDLEKVRRAINTNNLALAKENFEGVQSFIKERVPDSDFGLNRSTLPPFLAFCAKIEEEEKKGNPNPLTYFFPQDPLTHWCEKGDGHGKGWETGFAPNIHNLIAQKEKAAQINTNVRVGKNAAPFTR